MNEELHDTTGTRLLAADNFCCHSRLQASPDGSVPWQESRNRPQKAKRHGINTLMYLVLFATRIFFIFLVKLGVLQNCEQVKVGGALRMASQLALPLTECY